MLQQTTVATVLPRYDDFLKIFPTMASLAAAPVSRVLAAWSQLLAAVPNSRLLILSHGSR